LVISGDTDSCCEGERGFFFLIFNFILLKSPTLWWAIYRLEVLESQTRERELYFINLKTLTISILKKNLGSFVW
jgi:hypothetical protein